MTRAEIYEYDMNRSDKVIVLASDGVWEFMQNDEVARIVYPFFEKRNAEGAAEALVKEAFKRWKRVSFWKDDSAGGGSDRRHHLHCDIFGREGVHTWKRCVN